jgi:hypothetical protein
MMAAARSTFVVIAAARLREGLGAVHHRHHDRRARASPLCIISATVLWSCNRNEDSAIESLL